MHQQETLPNQQIFRLGLSKRIIRTYSLIHSFLPNRTVAMAVLFFWPNRSVFNFIHLPPYRIALFFICFFINRVLFFFSYQKCIWRLFSISTVMLYYRKKHYCLMHGCWQSFCYVYALPTKRNRVTGWFDIQWMQLQTFGESQRRYYGNIPRCHKAVSVSDMRQNRLV